MVNRRFELRPCADEGEFLRLVEYILKPSFPPAELASPEQFSAGFNRGDFLVEAAFEVGSGDPLGVAIGTAPSSPREAILLTWLAVSAHGRGSGIGGALFDHVINKWVGKYDPILILGEVEDPSYHRGSHATGDPEARLRFYLRRGARRIGVPFVMPLVSANAARVDHMLLLAFAGRARAADAPADLLGEALTSFLTAYVAASPEPRCDDGRYLPPVEAMLRAAPQARLLD